MTTDMSTYNSTTVRNEMDAHNHNYENKGDFKGAVTFNNFKLGEYKDIFIPIYSPNIKVIDLFSILLSVNILIELSAILI